MQEIITLVIVLLSSFDVFLNYRLMHVRITVKKMKGDVEGIIKLRALKKYLNKKIKLNYFQLMVRILLMSSWVFYSMYASKIAVLCFVFSVIYSLMVYISVMNIKEIKLQIYLQNAVMKIERKNDK